MKVKKYRKLEREREREKKEGASRKREREKAGLDTAFFYVLNASLFCVLLKHATFFCILFSSFWLLMRPKRTMRSFVFFS